MGSQDPWTKGGLSVVVSVITRSVVDHEGGLLGHDPLPVDLAMAIARSPKTLASERAMSSTMQASIRRIAELGRPLNSTAHHDDSACPCVSCRQTAKPRSRHIHVGRDGGAGGGCRGGRGLSVGTQVQKYRSTDDRGLKMSVAETLVTRAHHLTWFCCRSRRCCGF